MVFSAEVDDEVQKYKDATFLLMQQELFARFFFFSFFFFISFAFISNISHAYKQSEWYTWGKNTKAYEKEEQNGEIKK